MPTVQITSGWRVPETVGSVRLFLNSSSGGRTCVSLKLKFRIMEKWQKICFVLCLFGLLKELRPSEPFLTQYLTGPWKNLTTDQVINICVVNSI